MKKAISLKSRILALYRDYWLMQYKFLNNIESPKDFRGFDKEQLTELCAEVRDYIINCCAVNPGHLGSSLGAVELIVGLHYVFDTPKDKIVFDVGHQAYAHKILTGRREEFKLNRTREGISGFPKRDESPYDVFGTGHASTSISAALGLAEAAAMRGSEEKVIALIGDGAMTGGLAIEGLNNAGAGKSDLLIILNDNNQSIDGNIGAVHEYLLKLTTDPTYNKLKRQVWNRLGEGRFRDLLQKMTKDTKSNMVRKSGGALFEALGFRYFGPINGNDMAQVVDTLKRLRGLKGPRILHVHTVKGKGYAPAEADPTVWHAPGKFNPETGERLGKYKKDRYQDVFGEVLLDLIEKDSRVVGITPAMSTGCGMSIVAKERPDRFYDVGIEEEHAVTFSAGLAAGGMRPFCNIYSSFSQRAYDQIIHDVALQNLPVTLCFDRSGVVGEDGATHQGSFDLAAYRSIPNTIISAPKNELELKNLMFSSLHSDCGPYIIRYPRGGGEGVEWRNREYTFMETGKGEKLVDGKRLAVLAIGPVANRAVEAAAIFKERFGYSPAVYNMIFLKPIDESILKDMAENYDAVLTLEDGCTKGGLFGEVSEYLATIGANIRAACSGIPDRFIQQDSQDNQRKECGLDTEGITDKMISMIEKLDKKT